MQDRLNFRIWHKPLKQMHYNDFVITATGYAAKIYEQNVYMMNFNQQDLEFDKQCIVMQCTGLKDKNGKLIYEGDIFAIHTHFDNLVPDSNEYRYADEKGISYFKVAYDNDKARFYLIRIKWIKWNTCHTTLDYIPVHHSIAGNIYDNPELTEGGNND